MLDVVNICKDLSGGSDWKCSSFIIVIIKVASLTITPLVQQEFLKNTQLDTNYCL
jgi:hypothetical protein